MAYKGAGYICAVLPIQKKKEENKMNGCGISKLDLKRRNRMQILRVVQTQGPISRVDISNILQITRAAVTIITNEMIDQHILEEIGEEPIEQGAEVRKGRRKILLDINETYKFAMGVYVDEKEVSMGLTTLHGAALDKRTMDYTGEMTPERLTEMVGETLETMLHNSCLQRENLLGVGVGIMPALNAAFEVKQNSESQLVCSRLQQMLEERVQLPVYLNNALLEFAMAGTNHQISHPKPENLVFLYWDTDRYCAIPLYDGIPLEAAMTQDRGYVAQICLDPNGAEAAGYPQGSVYAELSPARLQNDLSAWFSPEQTPVLHRLLAGDLSQVTMGTLLTAAREDTVLQDYAAAVVRKFCVLLYNLRCVYFADKICLYQLGLDEAALEQVRQCAADFAGADFAQAIVCSPIGERYRFLCGCLYVIRKGFYEKGGLQ